MAEACPKCGRARADGENACARCGLSLARWAHFSPPNGEAPEVAPLWDACVAEWEQAGAHDRLIAAASDLGLLPSVARRYRARRDADPNDPIAVTRLAQIGFLVEAAARRQAERPPSTGAMWLVWGLGYLVAALILAASLWFVARAALMPRVERRPRCGYLQRLP